jgi:hypothetical protein
MVIAVRTAYRTEIQQLLEREIGMKGKEKGRNDER